MKDCDINNTKPVREPDRFPAGIQLGISPPAMGLRNAVMKSKRPEGCFHMGLV